MNRAQILWLECWVALSGATYWLLPPTLPHHTKIVAVSVSWALLSLAAVWVEDLEDWAHRISSFFGFLLFTIEGVLGLMGVGGGTPLVLLALLHGFSFLLAVAGRYQARIRRRPRRSYERMAEEALADIRAQQSQDQPPT